MYRFKSWIIAASILMYFPVMAVTPFLLASAHPTGLLLTHAAVVVVAIVVSVACAWMSDLAVHDAHTQRLTMARVALFLLGFGVFAMGLGLVLASWLSVFDRSTGLGWTFLLLLSGGIPAFVCFNAFMTPPVFRYFLDSAGDLISP